MAQRPILTYNGTTTPLFLHNIPKYLPTAYNESMSLIQKINKVIRHLDEIGEISNGLVVQWNEVMNWIINDGLTQSVVNRLNEWLANGTIDDILKRLYEQVDMKIDKLALTGFYNLLNFQKVIAKSPTTVTGGDFIQGFAFESERNRYYVARQLNGGTIVKIHAYDTETNQVTASKQFTKSTGAYQEGLAHFRNDAGELCFLVRTTYDKKLAIFNFDKGTLGEEFDCEGGSKTGSDSENNYFISLYGDATRTFGAFIYDFQSVVNKRPVLIRDVKFDTHITNGEKVQGVTIFDDHIVLGRGSDFPVLSVINMEGVTLNTASINKKSLANLVEAVGESWTYENEGVAFATVNGNLVPVVAHCNRSNETVYFTAFGALTFTKLGKKVYDREITTSGNWYDLPLSTGVKAYGEDVKPQYMYDGLHVHLRGVCDHAPLNEISSPNVELSELPFPFKPMRNQFWVTVASGNADKINRIETRYSGKIMLISSTSLNPDRSFTSLDGIYFEPKGYN